MKLSELTYEFLESVGLSKVSMHSDRSDALSSVSSAVVLDRVKRDLAGRYGDVTLVITPEEAWYNQIRIEDAKWQADHDEYCADKAAFCAKYGCD